MDAEDLKRAAGEAAATEVERGMTVGLGTGSTVRYSIEALGRRLAAGELTDVVGIPTSEASDRLARSVGIPLATLAERPRVDVTIDGADEVSPELDLVKGLGGALVREKIVATASRRLLVVVDGGKLVERLGTRAPLPVAVVPFGWESHLEPLRDLGAAPDLRRAVDGSPFVTDDGLYILHCRFRDGVRVPRALENALRARPGIVATGLFLGLATAVYVAEEGGVRVIRRAGGG